MNLFQPSKCQISDDLKIQSFMDSYQLGARILKGNVPCHFKQCSILICKKIVLYFDLQYFMIIFSDLPELTSSTFDEKLMPEHLLRVCLEYRQTCAPSLECNTYNAYKVQDIPSCTFDAQLLLAYLITFCRIQTLLYCSKWLSHWLHFKKKLDTFWTSGLVIQVFWKY